MRFDNERATAWAERFDASRAEGTEEGGAADIMAEEFTRIGLRVEEWVVLGSRFPHQILPVLGWCGLGLGMTLAASLSDRGTPGVLQATAWVGAMLGWGVATLPGLRFGHGWPPRVASWIVLAGRADDGNPPARLVFRAPLDGTVLRGPEVSWWASSVTIGVLVGILFVSSAAACPRSGWALPVLGLLWAPRPRSPVPFLKSARHPGLRDNRTGLAVLLELARTWPRRADARIEAHFVAVGARGSTGRAHGHWKRPLGRMARQPTLLIDLSARA
ncbi:MAG: hypothetical protein WKF75_04250 [Singulisphaera sp.]